MLGQRSGSATQVSSLWVWCNSEHQCEPEELSSDPSEPAVRQKVSNTFSEAGTLEEEQISGVSGLEVWN